MLTFAGVNAHPKGVQCPDHGRVEEVVVKGYRPEDGHDDLHLRVACPSCDRWVKLLDQPNLRYPHRELVGLSRCHSYNKGVGR